jgi:RimJ/RimL family protein N-acetyltransferase
MSTCSVVLRRTTSAGVEVVGTVTTDVAAGEGLAEAAARVTREVAGVADVWAVDLSVSEPRFAADVLGERPETPAAPASRWGSTVAAIPPATIGFRAMTRADLPDVVSWQARPHVSRWWQDEATDLARAEEHYGPALDAEDPTRMWVVEVNGRSVGMLQDYLIGDHPEFALLTARPDAVGFDYLIGDPTWVGVGVGTRMLWTFLRDAVRPHYPRAREYFAAPDHRNGASLRVLDKLGFARGLWFDEPQPDGSVDTVVGCSLDVGRVLGRPGPELVTER